MHIRFVLTKLRQEIDLLAKDVMAAGRLHIDEMLPNSLAKKSLFDGV